MKQSDPVSTHYTQGDLLAAIHAGITKLGKTADTITIEDLGPVDEFHIGGRLATRGFLDQLTIGADDHVLDIGCGIGGASRFAANEYQCRVSGVDLTDEFVETGKELCGMLGMNSRVSLKLGSALDLQFDDAAIDKAFMLHVGMNIADKAALSREVWRVLRPGGIFGIYDIMQVGTGAPDFPVPWASDSEGSALAAPKVYRDNLEAAGFEIISERNRAEFALEFFDAMQTRAAEDGAPPLGLQIIMGSAAPAKIRNMVSSIAKGAIAPIELVARKP